MPTPPRGTVRRSIPTLVVVAAFVFAVSQSAAAQSIVTYAGGGLPDGRLATRVSLGSGSTAAVDAQRNLFVTDVGFHRIRRVDATTGLISTVVGNGGLGFFGDGGPAKEAAVQNPRGGAFDSAGNFFFSDMENVRVRRVDAATGIITTVAGNGFWGFDGDGGPAVEASFEHFANIAVGPDGDVYIADHRNQRIRKVDAVTGIVDTVVGNGAKGFSGDGGPATEASLYDPYDVTTDYSGDLYIADSGNHRIRHVDAVTGIITTIAGNGTEGFSGDGGPAIDASLGQPFGVAVAWTIETPGTNPVRRLYIGDFLNQRIREVDGGTGIITTVAGGGTSYDDGPATEAYVGWTHSVEVDPAGGFFFSSASRIRRVDPITGMMTTVAGGFNGVGDDGPALEASLDRPWHAAIGPDGALYIADYGHSRIRRVDPVTRDITTVVGSGFANFYGDGGPATRAAIAVPTGIAFDSVGNLLIADSYNHRIRRVDAVSGIITTVAGNGSRAFSGDGGPATEAALGRPSGVAVDTDGTIYIADEDNSRIRRVDASTGQISTVAGTSRSGFGGDGGPATQAMLGPLLSVALDRLGNLYIADERNDRIRRVDAITGVITTVAGGGDRLSLGDGGPATGAWLSWPGGVVLDGADNLHIADQFHSRVRRVDAVTGIITTVAGDGTRAHRGDGSAATQASLSLPRGLVFDASGNLFIADRGANRIRLVSACTAIDKPELLTPADGESSFSRASDLTWNEIDGTFSYDLFLDTTSPPTTKVASDLAGTSFHPPRLRSDTTYFWQVVAKGDPNCEPQPTAESEVWSFTTSAGKRRPVRRP